MVIRRLFACTLVLAVIAATGSGTLLRPGRVTAASTVHLTVWLPDYCAPTTQTWFKNTFQPAFAKAHPQIDVSMVYVDWGIYNAKMATAFAAGSAPDVLETGASYVPDLVIKNQVRSIDAYLPAWGLKQDFYPGTWQDTVWQGHNYGVPYLTGVRGLVYRKSLLKAAGISHPPTTWDELYTDAVKLTKRDAHGRPLQLGFSTSATQPINYFDQWLLYFLDAGGSLTTPDNHKATIDTPTGIAAAAFFVKLFQAMTPGGVGLSNKLVAPFESGKLAMEINNPSVAAEVLQYNPKILSDVGVAAPMVGPGVHGKQVAVSYNDWLGMTSQSKNPQAAWAWISFATQPTYLAGYDQTCQAIPPAKQADAVPWVTSNPVFRQFVKNDFPYSVAFPFFPHIVEMWEKVGAELGKAAYGQESPTQAMHNAEAEANTVLGGTSTH